jgi:hypothetical protein
MPCIKRWCITALTARQRQWLHQWIGEREEAGYGECAKEIAAELAVHFEQRRDYRRRSSIYSKRDRGRDFVRFGSSDAVGVVNEMRVA